MLKLIVRQRLSSKITFVCLLVIIAFFLVACGKHDEVRFKIDSECNDKVCSIAITSLDSVYQQDLIKDQLLYSKPIPKYQISSNIKWYPNESDNPVLENNDELEAKGLKDCKSNGESRCTLYGDPTGFKFNTQKESTNIAIEGDITVNGIDYPVNLSKEIRFADLAAPVISMVGKCDNNNLDCSFKVDKAPNAGEAPYDYRWYIDGKQLAQTKSNDKNKGELNHKFRSLTNNSLYMVAVDKNGDLSDKSNVIALGDYPIIDSVTPNPSQVGLSGGTVTYTATMRGDNTVDATSGYTWTVDLSSLTPDQQALINHDDVSTNHTNKFNLTIAANTDKQFSIPVNAISVVAKDDKGYQSDSKNADSAVGVAGASSKPVISTVTPNPNQVGLSGGTVTYTATATGDNNIDATSGYTWTVDLSSLTPDQQALINHDDVSTNHTNKFKLTIAANTGETFNIPSDAINVVAKDDKGNVSDSKSADSVVSVLGVASAPVITSVDPDNTQISSLGGFVQFTAKAHAVNGNSIDKDTGFTWSVDLSSLTDYQQRLIRYKTNHSNQLFLTIGSSLSAPFIIPRSAISVVVEDDKGNISKSKNSSSDISVGDDAVIENSQSGLNNVITYDYSAPTSKKIQFTLNKNGGLGNAQFYWKLSSNLKKKVLNKFDKDGSRSIELQLDQRSNSFSIDSDDISAVITYPDGSIEDVALPSSAFLKVYGKDEHDYTYKLASDVWSALHTTNYLRLNDKGVVVNNDQVTKVDLNLSVDDPQGNPWSVSTTDPLVPSVTNDYHNNDQDDISVNWNAKIKTDQGIWNPIGSDTVSILRESDFLEPDR
ncbi:hypothetical protein [Francisella sp. SYW-9]|uniref:hypothetical protein n=1 Tax=Francisella sp. SYW-9 TaxID=2610888 RepID=UPI00123CC90F|nr:hypothetical protein [Francisella sp. SYW-9]